MRKDGLDKHLKSSAHNETTQFTTTVIDTDTEHTAILDEDLVLQKHTRTHQTDRVKLEVEASQQSAVNQNNELNRTAAIEETENIVNGLNDPSCYETNLNATAAKTNEATEITIDDSNAFNSLYNSTENLDQNNESYL